jgi:hypothetical protein
MTREDWEDWLYESSQPAQERGRRAREQYARGEYKTLEQIKEHYRIEESKQATQGNAEESKQAP